MYDGAMYGLVVCICVCIYVYVCMCMYESMLCVPGIHGMKYVWADGKKCKVNSKLPHNKSTR